MSKEQEYYLVPEPSGHSRISYALRTFLGGVPHQNALIIKRQSSVLTDVVPRETMVVNESILQGMVNDHAQLPKGISAQQIVFSYHPAGENPPSNEEPAYLISYTDPQGPNTTDSPNNPARESNHQKNSVIFFPKPIA